MIKCEICGKEFKTKLNLGSHIKLVHDRNVKQPSKIHCKICNRDIGAHAWGVHLKTHNYTVKQYYDTYLKQPNEGFCINCGKPTTFYSTTRGYAKICSQLCQKQHVWDNMTDEQKNISISKNSKSVKKYRKNRSKEENLRIHRKMRQESKSEHAIIDSIKSIYNGTIFRNKKSKQFIYPYELDIILPDINLAIEYNGTWFHSNLAGKPKDYHLMKSLLCRKKGIRLIHIYEFEDLNEQISLLKSLILGKDKYPKGDFNKNNLINNIPTPAIVYQDKRLTIYGAGKLIKT